MCRAKSSQTSDFRRASVSSQSAVPCKDHAFWDPFWVEEFKVAGGGHKSTDCQRVVDFPLLGAQILPDNSGTRKKVKDAQVGSSILPPS